MCIHEVNIRNTRVDNPNVRRNYHIYGVGATCSALDDASEKEGDISACASLLLLNRR